MPQDSLEQLTTQIRRHWEFALRVMRRWWVVAAVTFIGAAASVGIALSMTRIYQSRTMITVKDPVDKGSVLPIPEGGRNEDWLRMRLDETFSSRTLALRIIGELDLFPKMRGAVAPEVLFDEFSAKTTYGLVGTDSFWIAFEYRDPSKAQQVAERLADEFIRANVSVRLRVAQATTAFMEREAKRAQSEMENIERSMAEFVSDHPEYQIDPSTGLSRGLPAITGTPGQPRVGDPVLQRALTRKGRLEAQLQVALNPQGSPRLAQARQELDRARSRLLSLRQKYTDKHPDVQRALTYVRQMQLQVTAAQAEQKSGSSVERLRGEIASLDEEIAKLSARLRQAKPGRAKQPTRQLSRRAQLERRFYELTRDREVAKARFEQLQEQLLRSRVAANLERKQTETQFSIVDRANLPRKPVRPNRTRLALVGTALGLMLGIGLAVLLALFDPRIYDEDDLRRICDLPVLAQIPKES